MRVFGNLINRISEAAKQPVPQVGMGATITMYSDRKACTIVKITPKEIHVQEDISTRTDNNGMSENQNYTYSSNTKGAIYKFRFSKKYKIWKNEMGGLIIGERDAYWDYGF